jgi:hypothetical protein
MRKSRNRGQLGGLVLHGLVGGLMTLSGSAKLLGLLPPEAVDKLGLGEHIRLVGAGELLTAILLLIPWTLPVGILLASSFWGGAICLHMAHSEPYVAPSVLLVLSWTGAYLRNPAMFDSLSGRRATAGRGAYESEAGVRG